MPASQSSDSGSQAPSPADAVPTHAPVPSDGPQVVVLARNAPLPLEPQGTPQPVALRNTDDLPALSAFWNVVLRVPAYARLVAAMSVDPEVPKAAKASLVVGGAYLVSPIDLIPGVIPVAGQVDDLYVVLTALRFAIHISPPEVTARHLAAQRIHPEQIDHDLGVIRRLVKVGAQYAWTFGNKAVAQATRQSTRLFRRAEAAARSRITHRGER